MMKQIFFTLSILIFHSSLLFATLPTQRSRLIHELQTKYADQHKEYPILIFDRDEVEYRWAKERAIGGKRVRLVQEYVLEKVGVDLEMQTAYGLRQALNIEGVYTSIPIFDQISQSDLSLPFSIEFQTCVVMPPHANSNQRFEIEALFNFADAVVFGPIYGGHTYDNLMFRLKYEDLVAINLYHELAHCLDKNFLPDFLAKGINLRRLVLSESFADAFSLLLLAKEGKTQVAPIFSLYRKLISTNRGPFFAQSNHRRTPKSLRARASGVIYYTSPVLDKVQSLIEENPSSFREKSLEELLELAFRLTKKHALSFEEATSIYSYLANQGPGLETEALLNYKEHATNLLKTAFVKERPSLIKNVPPLNNLDKQEMCSLFKTAPQNVFF